jgi:hypothetical protein
MNTSGPDHTANFLSPYEIRLAKFQHLCHMELKISYDSIFTRMFETGVDFLLKYPNLFLVFLTIADHGGRAI